MPKKEVAPPFRVVNGGVMVMELYNRLFDSDHPDWENFSEGDENHEGEYEYWSRYRY